jgi:aspartyl-tRNA(Asn)/glutamyl-tRNA(Gln) amidotransferase subunit C
MPDSREIDVPHVARLARVNLTVAETELFAKQLRCVLEYAEKLGEAGTSAVNEPLESERFCDVFRHDQPRDWFTSEEALSNAPRQANDLFVVPKVVE